MQKNNKSYRIKYDQENPIDHINIKIDQDFDLLEVLTMDITQEDAYKLYTSNYGVVVGRVLANDGFGIPNAKISIFLTNNSLDQTLDSSILYPYKTTSDKNNDGIRYNLLPSNKTSKCYQNVGSFPSKRDILDNNSKLEVFDNFYRYTTTTNESGDYMFFGIPTGVQSIHVDIDLSDIGVLSQTPRDMVYKGYGLKQFDSPNKFKKSTNLDSLPQIISQDTTVFVYPFWGDETQGEIAISKKTINIPYKFEPTCVFMGSIFTDSEKGGISKTCRPNTKSGIMSEMTTSQGSIEMIRQTIDGKIEKFDINGTRVINNDGVWCYQIPMNLDYVITDEYGNLVPTTDPTKGIPTRTNVRFRVQLDDVGDEFVQSKTGVYLIPNNPKNHEDEDYEFNQNCKSTSFVNLFWNKVYSVKNYIPRIGKSTLLTNIGTDRHFNGIKSINYHESNNPTPYNNIWIDINLRFMLMCLLTTFFIIIVSQINRLINNLTNILYIPFIILDKKFAGDCNLIGEEDYVVPIGDSLLLDIDKQRIDGYQIQVTRLAGYNLKYNKNIKLVNGSENYPNLKPGTAMCNLHNTDILIKDENGIEFYATEKVSINFERVLDNNSSGLTKNIISCIETQLSSENGVINFDFSNDWLNGSLYSPKFLTKTSKNKKTGKQDPVFCGSWYQDYLNLYTAQPCTTPIDKTGNISGSNTDCSNGKCYQQTSTQVLSKGTIRRNDVDNIFYYRSIEFPGKTYGNKFLQATDVILLGSLNDCDQDGIPKLHQLLPTTSFKLPPDSFEADDTYTNVSETSPAYEKYMSGIDWGNKDTDGHFHDENGLFVAIDCMDSTTISKTCINASRLCEIGVNFDEKYSGSTYNGSTLMKYIDGYISTDEISDGDSRAMFSTLNGNGLKTKLDKFGRLVYDFTYNYPNGFDGKLRAVGLNNPISGDTFSNDYYKFRFGLNSDSEVGYDYNGGYSFPRYNNSFYFYFGLKPGNTSLDLFNNQYYVPCSDTEKDKFDVIYKTTGSTYLNNGVISLSVDRCVYPYNVYVNNILTITNIYDNKNIYINNLSNNTYTFKIIDSNLNEVVRVIQIIYIPTFNYSTKFNNYAFEEDYQPTFNYTQTLNYVDEQILT